MALGWVGEWAPGQVESCLVKDLGLALLPWAALLLTRMLLPCFGPDRNSYSLYCAELMANMKDVPSTERMVLCSQQWKLLSQKEKDAYHKKCDQVSCGGRIPGEPGEP